MGDYFTVCLALVILKIAGILWGVGSGLIICACLLELYRIFYPTQIPVRIVNWIDPKMKPKPKAYDTLNFKCGTRIKDPGFYHLSGDGPEGTVECLNCFTVFDFDATIAEGLILVNEPDEVLKLKCPTCGQIDPK